MNPLLVVLALAGAVSALVWVLSLITGEHSWVDRAWSIVPVAYVWIFAGFTGLTDARLIVMAVLATLWGARLTFNFARKGGYSGQEDYRWAILRGRMARWQFELFNLFFIVGFQNSVLVLITLPALTAYENQGGFGTADVVVTALFALLLVGETVADQQQWNFQAAKKARLAAGNADGPSFLQAGLWRFSRHPNFFFEQAQWYAFFLFGAIAAGSLAQWTIVGALLLTAIFIGSTRFTESITRSKYPEYADYHARTSPVVPLPPRRPRESRAPAQ